MGGGWLRLVAAEDGDFAGHQGAAASTQFVHRAFPLPVMAVPTAELDTGEIDGAGGLGTGDGVFEAVDVEFEAARLGVIGRGVW